MKAEQSQDQGFYPQVITIENIPLPPKDNQQKRPRNYRPNQLAQHIPLSKTPQEMLEAFTAIPVVETPEQRLGLLIKDSSFEATEQASTPFERYVKQPNKYRLIYAKYGPESRERECLHFATRTLPLPNVLDYQQSQYKPLQNVSIEQFTASSKINGISFDSRFQSGNLFYVFESLKQNNFYHCFAENDTNSVGYSQWFYFSLRGAKKDTLYRFLIPNLVTRKRFAFFKEGMKPVLFSANRLKKTGSGWFRRGYNVSYSKSTLYYLKNSEQIYYYSLYFELDFDFDDDLVMISFAMPYSYSRLIHQLSKCAEVASQKQVFWELNTIEYSLSNNQVPEVIITDGREEKQGEGRKLIARAGWKGSTISKKKIIAILARQHACEVNSSFLVEEILFALARRGNYKIAWLLNNFQFRIYPMVNVDGVIYGNSRMDLAGFDLNRSWRRPLKELNPQVYTIKRHLINLHRFNKIAICLDLHSHSKKYNLFTHGFKDEEVFSRLFSYIMSQNVKYFDFSSCRFDIPNQKEKTARGVLAKKIGTVSVVTIESSYFGAKQGEEVKYFQPQLLEKVGRGVLNSLKSYLRNDRLKKEGLKYLQDNIEEISQSQCEDQQNASQSDPEGDAIPLQQRLKMLIPSELVLKRISTKLNQESEQEEQAVSLDASPFKKYQGHRQSEKLQDSSRKLNPKEKLHIAKLKKKHEQTHDPLVSCSNQSPVNPQKTETTRKNRLSLDIWNKELKRIRTEPDASVDLKAYASEQSPKNLQASRERPELWDESAFRKEMKRLFQNLKAERRDQYARNFKMKRDNEFTIKNCRPKNQYSHYSSLLPQYERSFRQKTKISNLKSLLLRSDQANDEALVKIRSQSLSERDEGVQEEGYQLLKRDLTNSYVLERNFEEQFKRLKLQYSQRCNANLSIFTRLMKRNERVAFKQ